MRIENDIKESTSLSPANPNENSEKTFDSHFEPKDSIDSSRARDMKHIIPSMSQSQLRKLPVHNPHKNSQPAWVESDSESESGLSYRNKMDYQRLNDSDFKNTYLM